MCVYMTVSVGAFAKLVGAILIDSNHIEKTFCKATLATFGIIHTQKKKIDTS